MPICAKDFCSAPMTVSASVPTAGLMCMRGGAYTVSVTGIGMPGAISVARNIATASRSRARVMAVVRSPRMRARIVASMSRLPMTDATNSDTRAVLSS